MQQCLEVVLVLQAVLRRVAVVVRGDALQIAVLDVLYGFRESLHVCPQRDLALQTGPQVL
jgi:hypothetical protein